MGRSADTAGYHLHQRDTKAHERSKMILDELARAKSPVPLQKLVEDVGPYYLEVQNILAALEVAHVVIRYEDDDDHRKVAYRLNPRKRVGLVDTLVSGRAR